MKVTIKDVAQKAGVSIATVSRVFNGYDDIGLATKNKVIEVAKELGYVPNAAARALSSKQYKKIAMVINDLKVSRTNTIPLEILTGVYEMADMHDVDYVLLLTNNRDQEKKSLSQYCLENNISGLVLHGFSTADPYLLELATLKIPNLLIDIHPEAADSYGIAVNNEIAAYQATEFLISRGHRAIAMISGKSWAQVSKDRESGYQKCMADHHLPTFIYEGLFSEEYSEELVKDILSDHPEITALFCASDLMAIGAVKGIQAMNLNVPQDISVIGFDDIAIAKYVTPSLTTIKQDMHEIGRRSCEILLEILDKGQIDQKQFYVKHSLIERESVSSR